MEQKLSKPITIVRQEFIDEMIKNVNDCQLPLFVIESILQDVLTLVKTAAQKQYENDKIQYEQQLKLLKHNQVNSNENE